MTFEQLTVTKTRSLTGWQFRPLDLENLFCFDLKWPHVISSAEPGQFFENSKNSSTLKIIAKSEWRKNLSNFWENLRLIIFRYVCQNNDFHYKASKIRLDVNYKLTKFYFLMQFSNFGFFEMIPNDPIWLHLTLRWNSSSIPRNLSIHW